MKMPRILAEDNQRLPLYFTGLTVFLFYILYLCPSIYNGDSPLFYTSAFSLGLAHPPGYPLYIFLGKVFTFIPFGSIAYKLNLFSALCGVIASMFVFKSVYILTRDNTSAVFSALLSAFLPLAWTESLKAEVYTLNAAMVTAVFYISTKFLNDNGIDRRLLFAVSFIIGLGMGNHHTIGFMVFPSAYIYLIYLMNVRGKRFSTFLLCGLFFSLGMGIYLMSYVCSLKFFSSGILFAYSDASTFKKFIMTFFREQYGSSIPVIEGPARSPISLLYGPYNTAKYFIFRNMGLYSLLTLPSILLLWKRKPLLIYSLVSLASYGVILSAMVFSFSEPNEKDLFMLDAYMLPVLYLTVISAGYGLSYMLMLIKRHLRAAARPIAIGIVMLPFVFNLPHNLKHNDISNYYLADDFANNMLESLPTQSVVLSGSDVTYFTVFYKTLIERERDDVLVLLGTKDGIITQVNPEWKYKALFPELPNGKLFSRVNESHVQKGHLFAYDILNLSPKIRDSFILTPYIHCYRLFPKEHKPDEAEDIREYKKAFEGFVYERALNEKASDIFSTELRMYYFIPLTHYAYLMKKEQNTALSKGLYETSLKLITPGGLVYYMIYLDLTGRTEETGSFIESIEPHAKKYPEVRLLSTALKEHFLPRGGYEPSNEP